MWVCECGICTLQKEMFWQCVLSLYTMMKVAVMIYWFVFVYHDEGGSDNILVCLCIP